eukprot:3748170-Rhodomonas_salina.3
MSVPHNLFKIQPVQQFPAMTSKEVRSARPLLKWTEAGTKHNVAAHVPTKWTNSNFGAIGLKNSGTN